MKMNDSDEENFVKYGTPLDPLDEDSLPRKKPVTLQEQVAVDEYGRRRFHGAFTGGFSAGYFNSVGTRDGWKPQQFKSSRASKAGEITQRPEDFMDEEDTGEFGFAPTGIRATQDYADVNKRGTKRERARQFNDGPIPGIPVLHQILKPTRERVGVRLLKKMGWKPGQGVGPRLTKKEKVKIKEKNEKLKVYGCYMPSQRQSEESESDVSDDEYSEIMLAPDDYELFRTTAKDNYFGLGYSGLDKRPILSSHINLFEPTTTFSLQEKNKKLSIKGQAFGVGAFEEDDEDIYAKEDMSRYDFVLGPKKQSKSRWNRDEKGNTSKVPGCLEGFVPAKNPMERRKIYKPPELPKDFKPIHVVRKSRFFPPIEAPPRSSLQGGRKLYGGQNLNAITRASIIGEPSVSRVAEPASTAEEGKREKGKEDTSSVASKIIIKTLNLHGKEQVAERQKLEEERKVAAVTSHSWMDKLYTASFVKGGVVGSGLGVEGSLKNLSEFKERTEAPGPSSEASDSRSPAGGGDFAKPFIADPDKQRRFEQYLIFRKGSGPQKLATIQPLSMTEWDRNQESAEFEQAARIFDSSLHASENKFVSSGAALKSSSTFAEPEGVDVQMKEAARIKMFGKLTRVRTVWQPSSLICKRFNVAEPRVGCAVEEKKKKYSIFESLEFCNAEAKFERGSEEKRECGSENRVEMVNVEEEKMTEKEKSFEAVYVKVFGKGEEEKSEDLEVKKEVESGGNLEVRGKEKVEKKMDLFKAIFLSSSEDSDSEVDESLDSEAVKSVLIGKTSEVNLGRNTSPPRGIFANVDLDSLLAPVDRSENSEDVEASGSKSESGNANSQAKEEPEVACVDVLPPNAYGPLPPTRVPKVESAAEEVSDLAKPVYRSVALPKIVNKSEIKGEWVERTKVKKSKKEKKKHKHKERDRDKERSKHKKKSKKSKK